MDFHCTHVPNVIWPPEFIIIVGFMVDYIVCRMREVVIPIYPDACGVDVTGHKALDGTGHQGLVEKQWPNIHSCKDMRHLLLLFPFYR